MTKKSVDEIIAENEQDGDLLLLKIQNIENVPGISSRAKILEDRKDDKSDEAIDVETKFNRKPNSIYIHYVTIDKGRFVTRHYWCNKFTQDQWEHDEIKTREPRGKSIKPSEISSIVESVLAGTYREHSEFISGWNNSLNVSWRWISWVVVVFDHEAWEFVSRRRGLVFQEIEADHSFFARNKFTVKINNSSRTAFRLANYMRKDAAGTELSTSDKPTYKFDLQLYAELKGGTKVLVKIDPTGTNDGPTGGGHP